MKYFIVVIRVNFQIVRFFFLRRFKTWASKLFVKDSQLLLLAGSRSACGKIMVSGTLTAYILCNFYRVCVT